MPLRVALRVLLSLVISAAVQAQTPELSKAVQQFVRVGSPKVILTHVRIIDGTGAPAVDDQNIVIENGKITSISQGADVASSANTTVLNLAGYSVMPGIVGMHNHLFYIARPNFNSQLAFRSACHGAGDGLLRRRASISPAASPPCALPAASRPIPT